MSLNLIFHMSDFHNLKIVNNIIFFIFTGGLIFLSRGVKGCTCFGTVTYLHFWLQSVNAINNM